MTNLSSLTIILVIIGYCNAIYIMGRQGQSCWDACFEQQLNCGKKKKNNRLKDFDLELMAYYLIDCLNFSLINWF